MAATGSTFFSHPRRFLPAPLSLGAGWDREPRRRWRGGSSSRQSRKRQQQQRRHCREYSQQAEHAVDPGAQLDGGRGERAAAARHWRAPSGARAHTEWHTRPAAASRQCLLCASRPRPLPERVRRAKRADGTRRSDRSRSGWRRHRSAPRPKRRRRVQLPGHSWNRSERPTSSASPSCSHSWMPNVRLGMQRGPTCNSSFNNSLQ